MRISLMSGAAVNIVKNVEKKPNQLVRDRLRARARDRDRVRDRVNHDLHDRADVPDAHGPKGESELGLIDRARVVEVGVREDDQQLLVPMVQHAQQRVEALRCEALRPALTPLASYH